VIQKPAIPVEFLLFLSDWEVREDIWRGTVSFDAEDKHFKTRTILVPESVEVQALRSSRVPMMEFLGVPGVPGSSVLEFQQKFQEFQEFHGVLPESRFQRTFYKSQPPFCLGTKVACMDTF
jgi:hypothetical protein